MLVDRHERVHPVVASPLLEVLSAENPRLTVGWPIFSMLLPEGSRRHQCRLVHLSSRFTARQHLHVARHRPSQSSGRYVCRHYRRVSPLRERSTFWSTNTFPYGGAHAPYSRTTASTSVPSFYSCLPAVGSVQACHNLL